MSRTLVFRGALVAGLLAFGALAAWSRPLTAPPPDSVYLEEMTWVELREVVGQGATTVIVPTGGVEQNGPHLVLGKHNYIVRQAAGRVAEALGQTVVAPVIAYVPEGDIERRAGHMAFTGTLSLPEEVFAAVLEHTARSLRVHGFTLIAFLGDSGGNQAAQVAVAAKLNAEWAGGVRVLHVGDYYDPSVNGQIALLREQGESDSAIGSHAGIRDSSELMAVFPEGVRRDRLARNGGLAYTEPTGVIGDPTRASAERGEALLRLKVEAALRQIRAALGTGDS
jgi:creatinine amidohydrolase/Fe(II)-dependent formamide hydrolase-like protein